MSNLDSYELTHPDLLSEHQLREILRNSCIEIYNFEKLCKSELLEMYKRIAMPLPQRQYGNARSLDIEVDMVPEKSLTIIRNNNMHSLNISVNKKSLKMSQLSYSQEDRLKDPVNDQKLMPKKIRLCPTSKIEIGCNGISKRRCDDKNEESLTTKRQKITWP